MIEDIEHAAFLRGVVIQCLVLKKQVIVRQQDWKKCHFQIDAEYCLHFDCECGHTHTVTLV